MSAPKRPVGRPAVAGEAREVTVRFRCTAEERTRMKELAEEHEMSFSEWLRGRATTTGSSPQG